MSPRLLAAAVMIAVATAGIPLGQTPAAVVHFCHKRATRNVFMVLCPTRYPRLASSNVMPSGTLLLSPSYYWASFNDPGFADGDQGHIVLGGQRPPLSLVGRPGQTWPRPGQRQPIRQLPLPRLLLTPTQHGPPYVAERRPTILHATRVGGAPALVLSAATDYPLGGLLSGHLIVIWNRGGHGYFISLHFAAYPDQARLQALLEIAASSAPVT
jgi:hypothetical protein